MTKFKVGDVVTIEKSDVVALPMTVEWVKGNEVGCVWWYPNKFTFDRHTFQPSTLVLV